MEEGLPSIVSVTFLIWTEMEADNIVLNQNHWPRPHKDCHLSTLESVVSRPECWLLPVHRSNWYSSGQWNPPPTVYHHDLVKC